MKKKIIFITIAITGVIATFNINIVENNSGDISLQNVEVLSFGESGASIRCSSIGNLDCPRGGAKVAFIW